MQAAKLRNDPLVAESLRKLQAFFCKRNSASAFMKTNTSVDKKHDIARKDLSRHGCRRKAFGHACQRFGIIFLSDQCPILKLCQPGSQAGKPRLSQRIRPSFASSCTCSWSLRK